MVNVVIDLTATGTLVTPLTSQYERVSVTSYHIQFDESLSQTVTLQRVDQAGNVVSLTGPLIRGVIYQMSESGWWDCMPGEGLKLVLGNGTRVRGSLTYKIAGAPYRGIREAIFGR